MLPRCPDRPAMPNAVSASKMGQLRVTPRRGLHLSARRESAVPACQAGLRPSHVPARAVQCSLYMPRELDGLSCASCLDYDMATGIVTEDQTEQAGRLERVSSLQERPHLPLEGTWARGCTPQQPGAQVLHTGSRPGRCKPNSISAAGASGLPWCAHGLRTAAPCRQAAWQAQRGTAARARHGATVSTGGRANPWRP